MGPFMRIKAHDVVRHLGSMKPVYLVCGDEPFLVEEAVAAIIGAAMTQGYADRQRYSLESGFSWPQFQESLASPSLFSARSIYELRVPAGGREALGRELKACLPVLHDQALLLVITGALEKATLQAGWVEAIAERGHVVMAVTPEGAQFRQWIEVRLHQVGCSVTDMADRIAFYADGNLAAADQAIRRLAITPDATVASLEDIMGDEARFDVFVVADAALKGDVAQAIRALRRLRAEDQDPILISWALTRELRLLMRAHAALRRKSSLDPLWRAERVWPARQALLLGALKRLAGWQLPGLLRAAARLDRVNKGRAVGDSWLLVERLTMILAGAPGWDL